MLNNNQLLCQFSCYDFYVLNKYYIISISQGAYETDKQIISAVLHEQSEGQGKEDFLKNI